ncbi:MAG: hypothetical protein ABI572_10220 [Actinomycetota bacterium]
MSDIVRIVVAEGTVARKGFLRFVLDGEGYDVVGEAATPAELARSVALQLPDVVVMDDGIGAISVGMVRQLSPATKVVLVWPGAVMPIGGDARVEPPDVLRELGLAIEALTGVVCATSLAGGVVGARDAATLREVLARGEAAQLHRPGEAAFTAATAPVSDPASALNRRLGTIALSGAAAAGALVLALTLGGSRIPVDIVGGAAAEPSSPGIGRPSISPIPPAGDGSGTVPGGWLGAGRSPTRGGSEPACNYYIETCLPPAGLTGTGGLSIGDIYAGLDASDAAAPRDRGRHDRRATEHDGTKPHNPGRRTDRTGHDGRRSHNVAHVGNGTAA